MIRITKGYINFRWLVGNLLFCIIVLSCHHEDTLTVPLSEEVFNLHIIIPDMQRIETRGAVENGMIENLHVLVFDHNGGFLSRSEAFHVSGNPGDYKVLLPVTDPDLELAEKKRIIHFVANYDWSQFSDVANLGKSENELIMSLSTSGTKAAYWQRVEEDEGIKAGVLSSPIELVYNMARISVRNNTTGNGNVTNMTFAIGDYLDHGTIAPYNLSTLAFDENAIIESTDATRQTAQESDLINRAGIGEVSDDIVECYEHVNSESEEPMYVIIKCLYPGDIDQTYYKIDIVDKEETTLLNIQRNCHYILNIEEVTARGSLTLEEAMANPASNNLIYSVLLEKYTSISYGDAALYIETTSRTLVKTNNQFNIGFSYYPDIAGSPNNTTVELSWTNDDDLNPALSNAELDKTLGIIKCTTASTLPTYGQNRARLVISSQESGHLLRRVINVYLRKPSVFVNPYITPSPIPRTANQRVDLHFSMDPDFPIRYYPFDVYISVTRLSPNVDPGYDSGLILDHEIKDRYRYKYTVRNTREQIVHFKTILNLAPEGVLTLESELFNTVTLFLK